MKQVASFTTAGFLKPYVLPIFIMFLIPGFSLWFFGHVERTYDEDIRKEIVGSIIKTANLAEVDRQQALEYYNKMFISKILRSTDPQDAPVAAQFEPVAFQYSVFLWMKRIALTSLAVSISSFLFVGVGLLWSHVSNKAQYWSLAFGWQMLQWSALIQVIAQSILIVSLSFWMTAFWTNQYYLKLIGIAGMLALIAVGVLIRAIFQKINPESHFEGRVLLHEEAPQFWKRVEQLAAAMGIQPPDQIFAGVDANFFVTEHSVRVRGVSFSGRTLFVSLPLLKTLGRPEADAILAHELAHFSGDDTLFSKKISPLLARFSNYLQALYAGGISRPVFYYMHFFWELYHMSLGKRRRERELRADRIGAEFSTKEDAGSALTKVTAYAGFRNKVETALFNKTERQVKMDVASQINQGLPSYLAECAEDSAFAEREIPHPFDSHPPLRARLAQLGLDLPSSLGKLLPLPLVENTCYADILRAPEIEAEQWGGFEQKFHAAHDENLAWRLQPANEKEIKLVRQYFPDLVFTDGPQEVSLDYEKIDGQGWEFPIFFEHIRLIDSDKHIFGRRFLLIEYRVHGGDKKRWLKRRVYHEKLRSRASKFNFLTELERYHHRYLSARSA